LAAVVGLAVLLALYLSQARDVKRLREWAGGAPERSGPGVTAVPSARQTVITPPRRSQPWYRRIGMRSVAVALVGLLVLGGAAAQLTGHDGDDDSGKYVPGHQAEAQAIGRRFGISQREPVTADSRALAGDATVIVIAGADKAP
jgi:hypothetical protein